MKSAFARAVGASLLAGMALLMSGCDPSSQGTQVPVTLKADDSSVVTVYAPANSPVVVLQKPDGKTMTCVQVFSERASTETSKMSLICPENQQVIQQRRNADAAAASAAAAAAAAAAAVSVSVH